MCFWRNKGDPFGLGFTVAVETDAFLLQGITLEYAVDTSSGDFTFAGMCFDILNPLEVSIRCIRGSSTTFGIKMMFGTNFMENVSYGHQVLQQSDSR